MLASDVTVWSPCAYREDWSAVQSTLTLWSFQALRCHSVEESRKIIGARRWRHSDVIVTLDAASFLVQFISISDSISIASYLIAHSLSSCYVKRRQFSKFTQVCLYDCFLNIAVTQFLCLHVSSCIVYANKPMAKSVGASPRPLNIFMKLEKYNYLLDNIPDAKFQNFRGLRQRGGLGK